MVLSLTDRLSDLRAGALGRHDWVRLRTVVYLRWIALSGQLAAMAYAEAWLQLDLPYKPMLFLVLLSAWVNIISLVIHPPSLRLSERGTLLTLIFDLSQLCAMLYFSGGMTNPFAMLLMAPVTVAATVLSARATLILGSVVILSAILLTTNHVPLRFDDGQLLTPPELLKWGFLAALVCGACFVTLYARRVALEVFAMSEALTATQLALAQEQRLSAIGALSAAMAHELGTPLATIKLVAGEMARELKANPDLAEDAALIRTQAERCRDILQGLSKARHHSDMVTAVAPIGTVLAEAAGPHQGRGKHIILRFNGLPVDLAGEKQPVIRRQPELIHGLRNLVQNAVDFANSYVWVDAEVIDTDRHGKPLPDDLQRLRITVGDDGPGYADEIIGHLGEPFNTSRGRDGNKVIKGYEGMGLGVFIAKTLLERSGGRVTFANAIPQREANGQTAPEHALPTGAIAEVNWPRHMLEAK